MNSKQIQIEALKESLQEITEIIENIKDKDYPKKTIENYQFQKFQIQHQLWQLTGKK